MNARLQRYGRVNALCAGLALALLGGGCVDNDISLTITKFIPPDPAGVSSGMCTLNPEVAVHIQRGVWDLSLAAYTFSGYDANFVVSNNLARISNQPVTTQIYYVNDFDIVLEPEGALAAAIPPSRREFSYHGGSVRLEPGGTAAAYVEAIPADLVHSLSALSDLSGVVVAKVRAVATRAEQQVKSAYASFPIQVCKGCLGNTDATGALPACPLPAGTPTINGNPCNFSQDDPVLCCAIGNQALCGKNAPIATM